MDTTRPGRPANGRELATLPVVGGGDLDLMTLGNVFAESGFFSDSRQAAQAITKIMAGRELGIGAIAAMTGIYIVKGRVTLGANLMAALVKRSGRYDYRVARLDNDACKLVFTERGERIGESTFTAEDAATAGLTTGDNWKHFPRNMLFARAMSNGAKWFCPDLFGGPLYTPAELGAAMDPEAGAPLVDLTTGEVIEAEAAPTPGPMARRRGAIEKIRGKEDELRSLGVAVAEVDLGVLSPAELRERAEALHQLEGELGAAGWREIAERAIAAGAAPIPEDIGSRELLEYAKGWWRTFAAGDGAPPEAGPDGSGPPF